MWVTVCSFHLVLNIVSCKWNGGDCHNYLMIAFLLRTWCMVLLSPPTWSLLNRAWIFWITWCWNKRTCGWLGVWKTYPLSKLRMVALSCTSHQPLLRIQVSLHLWGPPKWEHPLRHHTVWYHIIHFSICNQEFEGNHGFPNSCNVSWHLQLKLWVVFKWKKEQGHTNHIICYVEENVCHLYTCLSR